MSAIGVVRAARQVELYMQTPEGERVNLQRRPILQLKALNQSALVFTGPLPSQDPEAFAVLTALADGTYGLEVSKCGYNELHIIFAGTEIGVIPATTGPGVSLGYFNMGGLTL